jgi:hypothetical protein
VATDQLNEAWERYRAEILGFYTDVGAGYVIDGGTQLDRDSGDQAIAALDRAAESSQHLRTVADKLLGGDDGDYDEITVRLIAAAAVDCMLADQVLRVDPYPVSPDPEHAERARGVATELETRGDVIGAADRTFGGGMIAAGGGQNVDSEELHQECTDAIARLVDSAARPAVRFSFGAVNVAGMLEPVAETLDKLAGLEEQTGGLKGRALRFLGEGVRKLMSATGGEEAIGQALDLLRNQAEQGGAATLGYVVGRGDAETRVTAAFDPAAGWDDSRIDAVRGEIITLTGDYADQMQWTTRVARFIAHASPLISTLAAPIGGPVFVVALDGIGIGFVVYTLGARLNDDWLLLPGRVDSLITIVERQP